MRTSEIFLILIYFTSWPAVTHAAPEIRTPLIAFDSNVDDVFFILKKRGVKNVVEAVDLFDPRFFGSGNYRLFFHSQSIQPGSKEFPRIVLSGKDSKLFIGFNHKLGEDRALELIQFREETKSWEFSEIGFNNNKPVRSSANPKLCLQCHGDGPEAKPNVLRFDAARLERSIPYPSFIRIQPFASEKFWQNFVAQSKQDPVYSKLVLPAP